MRLLTIQQVAELCGVSAKVVRQWIRKGELRAVNLSATPNSQRPRLRVSEADLVEFLHARTMAATRKTQRRARRQEELPRYV